MSSRNLPNERSAAPLRLISLLGFLILLVFAPELFAITPVTEVIVKSGDPVPDGMGTFGSGNAFTFPVLNNHGWVGFRSYINNFAYGLFLANGATVIEVARTTNPALGGSFQGFTSPALNDPGQLLFMSPLVVNSSHYNLIRSEIQAGVFTGLLFYDQAAPDGNGTVRIANINQPPAFNQTGHAVFVVSIANTTGGANDDSAIYRTATAGSLTKIAREGENVPEGNGKFDQMVSATVVHPVLNESGQVAFLANLIGTSGGSADNSGLYRGDGNTLTTIARANESLPGGGTLVWFATDTGPDINDSGEIVFPVSLDGATGQEAIFKGSGGPLTEIARQGVAIPNSTDQFRSFQGYARINNSGQVAFISSVTRVPNPMSQTPYFGLFRADGNPANRILIAKNGQPTPKNVGIISDLSFTTFDLNNSDQIAFTAGLDFDTSNNTPIEGHGLFFFDQNLGVLEIVREGDPLLGSTITSFTLAGTYFHAGGTGVVPNERSGLNDRGQVAFGFVLADGREGIAIWSPTLQLLSAVSRKMHGMAGTFDIDLPLTGEPGIECRNGTAGHTLAFTFTNNIVSGNAAVTGGVGSVSGPPTFSGHTMTVNLTGVNNAQKITVTLSNVTDAAARVIPSANVSMNALLGDTTANKSVNSSDVAQTKSRAGMPANFATFRSDTTVNGNINSSDVAQVKSKTGTGVP